MHGSYEEQIHTIFETYYQDIYYFLYHFVGNRSDAEDMAQEVFVRVLMSLHQYDGRVQLKTWIFSIAKHVAIDQYRRKKLWKIFSDIWIKDIPAKDGLPEEKVVEKERERELREAILKLPPKYRIVIIFRAIKECSIRETAEILGVSESKVKVDYHRAIKMIQERLSGDTTRKGGSVCTGKTKISFIKK